MSFSCSSVASYGMFPTAETDGAAGQRGGYRPRRRGGEPAGPRLPRPARAPFPCRPRRRRAGSPNTERRERSTAGSRTDSPAIAPPAPLPARAPPARRFRFRPHRARQRRFQKALRRETRRPRLRRGSAGTARDPRHRERPRGYRERPRGSPGAASGIPGPARGCRLGHGPRGTAPGEPASAGAGRDGGHGRCPRGCPRAGRRAALRPAPQAAPGGAAAPGRALRAAAAARRPRGAARAAGAAPRAAPALRAALRAAARPGERGRGPRAPLRPLGRSARPGTALPQDPVPCRAARRGTPARRLRDELRRLLGPAWCAELERDVPHAWHRHGDLVLLSEDCFRAEPWERLGSALWETVASALGARRVARRGRVMPDGMRSPRVTLLLGQHGWVEHVDNGIRYTFDVTKCMFSPGNITEKLRVASLPCSGEVVVDLYAGIGYFTLPFLVHAGAAFVHACEWNSHAVEALHRSLLLNGVRDRCRIHSGDSRQLQLRDVADRVNLGLLPSSEEGWPAACRALKKDTGGVLHIHQNVESRPVPRGAELLAGRGSAGPRRPTGLRAEWQSWAEGTAARIRGLLAELHGRPWRSSVLHVEPVKSYAPHVHHLVLDLECRPVLPA